MNIPVTLRTISRFLELSLGVTAWKQAGQTKWALRSNPSSGNLHPTEGFLLLPFSEDFDSGLYHYCPKDHGLEMRTKYDPNSFESLLSPFPKSSFLFGLSSIHWREAWKYGERAYRYCNHDVGHAIASIRIAAATLGWNIMMLDDMKQSDLALLLGTSRSHEFPADEIDHPESLMVVWPNHRSDHRDDQGEGKEDFEQTSSPFERIPSAIPSHIVSQLISGARWFGEANRLSTAHGDHWEIIDQVAADTWKSTDQQISLKHISSLNTITTTVSPARDQTPNSGSDLLSVEIIRQRRSAVAFDPETSILSSESFFQLLSRVFPRQAPLAQETFPSDMSSSNTGEAHMPTVALLTLFRILYRRKRSRKRSRRVHLHVSMGYVAIRSNNPSRDICSQSDRTRSWSLLSIPE
jgi:SagB-type dehydrogenase family enzyme